MDMYGMSSSDFSGVDELLDFSNDHDDQFATTDHTFHHNHNISSSSSTTTTNTISYHLNYDNNNNNNNNNNDNHHHMPTNYHHSTDFTDDLCVPSEDVAELEWLSNFVHDSFSNFPANNVAGTINYRPDNNGSSFHSRSRTKRTRAPTNNTTWTTTTTPSPTILEKTMKLVTYSHANNSDNSSETGIIRRCTHCASEKTPQWRTGPLGPKTLCNACGVRFKSGRLVPEYRPAASPTFVLTQHSNSHRKVMELRRQKEMTVVGHGHGHGQPQQSTSTEYQMYHHRQHSRSNYEVC